MDNRVRDVLRDLVAAQGEALLASNRVRGLLADECPENRAEINILMTALQAQVTSDLRAVGASGTRVVINTSIRRLEKGFGLSRPAAAWAVLSITYAIGRISDEQFHSLLPDLCLEPAVSPPPDAPLPPPPPQALKKAAQPDQRAVGAGQKPASAIHVPPASPPNEPPPRPRKAPPEVAPPPTSAEDTTAGTAQGAYYRASSVTAPALNRLRRRYVIIAAVLAPIPAFFIWMAIAVGFDSWSFHKDTIVEMGLFGLMLGLLPVGYFFYSRRLPHFTASSEGVEIYRLFSSRWYHWSDVEKIYLTSKSDPRIIIALKNGALEGFDGDIHDPSALAAWLRQWTDAFAPKID